MFDLYVAARSAGLRPALLETATPASAGEEGLSLLGYGAASRMEVRDGATWLDGRKIGGPLEILRRLESGLGARWFPAWIGYFSYEYARHLGLPAREPLPGIPEAAFHYYPQGFATRGGAVLEAPEPPPFAPAPLPPGALPNVEPVDELGPVGHRRGVREIQARIRAGDVYQVNLSQRFRFPAAGVDPARLYANLRTVNPSPYMGLMEGDGWALVSGSPERLFSLSPADAGGLRTVRARPIAGTRPRGRTPEEDEALERELRGSGKERAEHAMLVDLLRNDLARCCEPGTVEVPEAFTVERYSHVMHLVSEVAGRTGASLERVFEAAFPGGSITGAPKASVMQALAELEPSPRGPYTGSLGYVSGAGVDFNILIRSFAFAGGDAFFSAGGGVVIDSEPDPERNEALAKAQALLQALRGGAPGASLLSPAVAGAGPGTISAEAGHGSRMPHGGAPWASPAPPRRAGSWRPPESRRRPGARVIFVENHDSFSFNVVDYLRTLGAGVTVVEAGSAPDLAGVTHLVVGPGPGEPATAGRTLDWIRQGLEARLPLLGICLGHQALGVALGARLVRSPEPIHGRAAEVAHRGEGIFAGIPNPAVFARYHSLCLVDLPEGLTLQATSGDGACMAISDREGLAWGVQFHPESMLSEHGMDLLSGFLAMERR